MKEEEKARMQAKTPEGRFKYTLKEELALSPKMAGLVLEEAQEVSLKKPCDLPRVPTSA
ncbi:MAG: hypothetical protein JXB30_06770 [Anaerolineae bacterium]|nr:hypothetical protein [Anaerolineae bacterium]